MNLEELKTKLTHYNIAFNNAFKPNTAEIEVYASLIRLLETQITETRTTEVQSSGVLLKPLYPAKLQELKKI